MGRLVAGPHGRHRGGPRRRRSPAARRTVRRAGGRGLERRIVATAPPGGPGRPTAPPSPLVRLPGASVRTALVRRIATPETGRMTSVEDSRRRTAAASPGELEADED